MAYNNSSNFSANRVVAVQNYYGAIGTINSVIPSVNSLTINYSVLPVMSAISYLVVNGSSITVSNTGTSYPVNNLPYNSGQYSVYIRVSYISSIGSPYSSSIVYATLPQYSFIDMYGTWTTNNAYNNYYDNTRGTGYTLYNNNAYLYQAIYPYIRSRTLKFDFYASGMSNKKPVYMVVTINTPPDYSTTFTLDNGKSNGYYNNTWHSITASVNIQNTGSAAHYFDVRLYDSNNTSPSIIIANAKLY